MQDGIGQWASMEAMIWTESRALPLRASWRAPQTPREGLLTVRSPGGTDSPPVIGIPTDDMVVCLGMWQKGGGGAMGLRLMGTVCSKRGAPSCEAHDCVTALRSGVLVEAALDSRFA